MKKIYFITFLLFLFQNVNAQDTKEQSVNEKKLWGSFDLGLMGTLSDNGSHIFGTTNRDDYYKAWGMRAMVGYYIIPRISLGFGVGNWNSRVLPVFFDFRYLLAKKWYAYTDIGGLISNGAAEKSGFVSEAGLGFRFRIWKKIVFTPSIGYTIMSYRGTNWRSSILKESTYWHQLFTIRLGFEI
ncbi:MAG: hypothetical protein LBG92_08860 [Prevotellaceae bacterium]|jgi:hypothetical protein|nr:hypothetical protein [Prevotellaceae bacterium]